MLRGTCIRSHRVLFIIIGIVITVWRVFTHDESRGPMILPSSMNDTRLIRLSKSFESIDKPLPRRPISTIVGNNTPPLMPTVAHEDTKLSLSSRVLLNSRRSWRDVNERQNYVARHECSFVQAGKKFYMFGGREAARRVDVYDYEQDKWTRSTYAPKKFNHFQATEYQGLIWVIAAFEENKWPDEPPAKNIYVYDPANNQWMRGPSIPAGRRRGAGGVVVYNDKFYIVGGNTLGHHAGYVPWFDEYDPHTNSWTVLPDAPHERDHFHAVVVEDKLYAIGGRRTSEKNAFGDVVKEVDVYDFVSKRWLSTDLPDDLKLPRAASAVAALEGRIMIMGGESGTQDTAYREVDELDTETGTWSTLPSMNHPRHGTQAIVSGLGVYVTGGSPVRGGGKQRNMEVYGPNDHVPTGIESTAGVLFAPSTLGVPFGEQKTITLQHVDGNQGVLVESISLSGPSANDFTFSLAENVTTPLLIGRNSSLDIYIEFKGTAASEAQLVVTFSKNQVVAVTLEGSSLEFEPIYINAGGSYDHTDSNGIRWTADSFFQNGRTWKSRGSMMDGEDGDLYLSERYGANLQYTIPNIPNGSYKVTLYFAENWAGRSGVRVFSVSMEGEEVFSDIDIYKEAGGKFRAMTKTATVVVSDGALHIDFTSTKQNPKVSGIAIEGDAVSHSTIAGSTTESRSQAPSFMPSTAPSKAPSFMPSTAPSEAPSFVPSTATSVMPSFPKGGTTTEAPSRFSSGITSSGSPSQPPSHSPSDMPSLSRAPSPPPFSLMFDVGKIGEDMSMVNGRTNRHGGRKSVDIAGTDSPQYFRTHRYGKSFTYTVDGLVAGASYTVSLGFAETYQLNCNIGKRVLVVSLNGHEVNPDLDVFKEVGCNVAFIDKYSVHATPEGKIVIGLGATVENAMLSLIQIDGE